MCLFTVWKKVDSLEVGEDEDVHSESTITVESCMVGRVIGKNSCLSKSYLKLVSVAICSV